MVISFYCQKGGVGKTHLCMHIAECLRSNDYKVGVLDFDGHQKTSTKWIERGEIPIENRQHGTVHDFKDAQVVLVDMPPTLTASQFVNDALKASSMIIVPCVPRITDMDSVIDTGRFLNDLVPSVKKLLVWTCVEENLKEIKMLGDAVERVGIKAASKMIPKRAEYARTFTLQWDQFPRDLKEDVKDLVIEILKDK